MTDCSVFWHHFLWCFFCSERRETNYVQVGVQVQVCALTPEGLLIYEMVLLECSSFENLLSWPFLISAHFSINIPSSPCWLMTNWSCARMEWALRRKREFSGSIAECGLPFLTVSLETYPYTIWAHSLNYHHHIQCWDDLASLQN